MSPQNRLKYVLNSWTAIATYWTVRTSSPSTAVNAYQRVDWEAHQNYAAIQLFHVRLALEVSNNLLFRHRLTLDGHEIFSSDL